MDSRIKRAKMVDQCMTILFYGIALFFFLFLIGFIYFVSLSIYFIPLFLSIIGKCPVECYQYKFDTSIYNNPQPKYKS